MPPPPWRGRAITDCVPLPLTAVEEATMPHCGNPGNAIYTPELWRLPIEPFKLSTSNPEH